MVCYIVDYCPVDITFDVSNFCRDRSRYKRKEEIMEQIIDLAFIVNFVANNGMDKVAVLKKNCRGALNVA
jgi:hypothetical protein